MQREKDISHKIAILATGDEVCAGDIVNTNSQEIALRLTTLGMHVRMHMAAPDSVNEIERAIQSLISTHDALIITGGLGPTSDDLTRYALAKAINRPLHFDNATWEAICARLKRFGYATPPESNKQQAMFPEGATIFPNPNGTAAGCMIQQDNLHIYMLPGPPSECLPMLENSVIDSLKSAGFQYVEFHKKWLLFGASEGKIAEELDSLTKNYNCKTGYRLCYPYLEFKIYSKDETEFQKTIKAIEPTLRPYMIDNGQQSASELLKEKLSTHHYFLRIQDNATGGLLEATLKTPNTISSISFSDASQPDSLNIEINGLKEFWENKKECAHSQIDIIFNENPAIKKEFPFRGSSIKYYAVEFICQQILLQL
ncbi:MAG: competence/damage-inducible protein A [Gammaproteobacteria bacterium]|nr:competence/damage-inducible protein A [Gammaproteobacteria bacterium]